MKTSAGLFLTDILPHTRGLFHKVVKNKVFGNLPASMVFSTLKKAGLDGIELFLPSFYNVSPEVIEELQALLRKEHVEILSVHQTLRFFSKTKIDEVTQLLALAHKLGAKVAVLHVGAAGEQIFDPAYIKAIHTLQDTYGVKVGFENREKVFGPSSKHTHHWEQEAFPKLMKENDFFITLDTTHLAQAGGDIVSFFHKNKDRIVNIHLSDYKHHFLNTTLRPLRYKHMPLGKGQLPVQQFLQLLHAENYQGLLTMEIHTDLEGMCESAKIINYAKRIEKTG